MQILVRLELQHCHQSIALVALGIGGYFHAHRHERVAAIGGFGQTDDRIGTPVIGRCRPVPHLALAHLGWRIEMGKTQSPADLLVGRLIDIRQAEALAKLAGNTFNRLPVGVGLTADVDGDLTTRERQRVDGAHIHGTSQTLANQAGCWCLVHNGRTEELRGKLIVFDRAVVARTDHFATIQKRRRKLWRHTAD